MVHRLRSRPHGLFGQRRHPHLRALARDHAGRQRRRGAAALPQQRGALDQAHQQSRLCAVRSRAGTRRGRRGAGHAGGDRRQGRLRVPEPALAGVRPERPRRLGPQRTVRPRRLRVHRARRLSLGRERARHCLAAGCAGSSRGRRSADAGGRAARRRRVPARDRRRPGCRRPQPRSPAGAIGADRHLARARLRRSEAPGGGRGDLHGRGLCAGSPGVRAQLTSQKRVARGAGAGHGRRPLPLRRARVRS